MGTHLLAVAVAILGMVLGPFIVRWAALRTTKQPVSIEIESEKLTLASVIQDPSGYVFVAELDEEAFVEPGHKALWKAIVEEMAGVHVPSSKEDEAKFEEASKNVPSDLVERLNRSHPSLDKDVEALTKVEIKLDRTTLLENGSRVFSAAGDRGRLGGAAPLSPGGPGEKLLVRRYQAPSKARIVFGTLFLVVSGALAPTFAAIALPSGSLAWGLGVAALFVLATFSLIWALVDLDTMYLDFPTFLSGTIAAWALTVTAAIVAGNPGRIISGAGIVLGTALFFELATQIYRRVRGQHGMGFGDTLIIIATAGVPAALAANWVVGYYSILVGMVCFVLTWVVLRLMGKVTRDTPFAFGPYLALGWVAAYIFIMTVGLNSLEFI